MIIIIISHTAVMHFQQGSHASLKVLESNWIFFF